MVIEMAIANPWIIIVPKFYVKIWWNTLLLSLNWVIAFGSMSTKDILQKSCPKHPVKKWTITTVYYPSVTPNCPTFVLRTPVWCSAQFEHQKAIWVIIKIRNTSSLSILVAWHMPNIKKANEKESQPWSKSWPSGDPLLVLLACFPSIASRVEYVKTQKEAKKKAEAGSYSFKV
jgi:hypothetical protein